jgi:hypothetical protein
MRNHTVRFVCLVIATRTLALGIIVYAVLSFLAYNLPNGLWLLSGLLFIRAIWWKDGKTGGIYVQVFVTGAVFLELCQLLENIPGTFDLLDLLLPVIIALAESFINKNSSGGGYHDDKKKIAASCYGSGISLICCVSAGLQDCGARCKEGGGGDCLPGNPLRGLSLIHSEGEFTGTRVYR